MNLMSLYSVPMWQSKYPEFKEHKQIFLDVIKKFREENPSQNKSNLTVGYHSPNTLHQLPELRPLYEYICQMAFKATSDLDFIPCDIAITSSWAIINHRRQCMNMEHVHSEVFSGVFYLQVPERSGRLSVRNQAINLMWKGCDLTAGKNEFTGETVRFEPVEGTILMFPSYLPHAVETNDHDEERISISFNITALPKGTITNN